jgi:carbamoyltransferase
MPFLIILKERSVSLQYRIHDCRLLVVNIFVKPLYILGLSAYYHDSAACLLRDGEIIAAAQEERFTRIKGDASFPRRAVNYCLGVANIRPGDLAFVGFYDKPLLKFERILETYLGIAPKGLLSFLKAGPLWITDKLYTDRNLRNELSYDGKILYSEHHESHAASAFFPSPFQEAAILTIDGVGEWATASIGIGRANEIKIIQELHFPDSLGLLYSAFTYHTGFKVGAIRGAKIRRHHFARIDGFKG